MPAESSASHFLSAALHYVERGWHVHPLKARSKKPATSKGMRQATTASAQIERWWRDTPNANVGIRCNRSGLLVVDIDPRSGGDSSLERLVEEHGSLPATLEVDTGGGGRHLYFQCPDESARYAKELAPGVDIKVNGYVVAPPSVHPSGGVYSWCDPDASIAVLPDAWIRAVQKSSRSRPNEPAGNSLAKGQRNKGLTSIAGRLRNAGLDVADLSAALEGINRSRCEPPLESDEVQRIAQSIARYEAGSPSRGEEVALRPFSEIEQEQVDWIWEQRVARGEITLLVGDPGLGKSQLTCWLAEMVTARRDTVLMASAEDSPGATIRPRLEVAGAELDRVHLVVLEDEEGVEGSIRIPDNVDALRRRIEKAGKVDLLVVDPLTAHLPNEVNSYRDQHVRTALAPLKRLAEEYRCAVVVVMHLNKTASDNSLYRVGGSIGFTGAARSVLLLARDPEDSDGERGPHRIVANVKNNLAREASSLRFKVKEEPLPREQSEGKTHQRLATTSRIVFVEEAEISGRQLLSPSGGEREAPAREEAVDFLLTLLADGPLPIEEVRTQAGELGISEATLRRAREETGVAAYQIKGEQHSWRYALPEHAPDGQQTSLVQPEGDADSALDKGKQDTGAGSLDYVDEGERETDSNAEGDR